MAFDNELANRLLTLFNFLKNKRKINSQRDFCLKFGLSESFFTEIKMRRSGINPDKLHNIQEEYKIYEDYLIYGNGVIPEDKTENLEIDFKTHEQGIPLIPISAMAGAFTGDMSILECECERFIIPAFKGADFLIRINGLSMFPNYNSGDIVACKKLALDTFFQWNKVYVVDTDQGPIIKRIKKGSSQESVLIVSDNPDYDDFELNRSSIYHIAIVIGGIWLE